MKRILLTLFVVAAAASGHAQTAEDTFSEAGGHYREERFADAAAAYERILAQGYVSAAVYFNLGNSYYRLGRFARAILAYERALRLEPGDADTQFNLRLANLRTTDRIDPVTELFFVSWMRSAVSSVPMSLTRILLVTVWVGLFLALSVLNLFPGMSYDRLLRAAVLILFIGLLPVGGLYFMQRQKVLDRSEAIVLERVVTAKASPDDRSVDAFVIHEGLKVQLGDSVGEWVRITLPDGKVGWVKAEVCERI
jgi:tetratricopeptide (TPR) repeat protein